MDSHKGSSSGSSITEIVLTIYVIITRMPILTTPGRVIFWLLRHIQRQCDSDVLISMFVAPKVKKTSLYTYEHQG